LTFILSFLLYELKKVSKAEQGVIQYPVLLKKDILVSTKIFGGFGFFSFAVVAKIFEKMFKMKLLSTY